MLAAVALRFFLEAKILDDVLGGLGDDPADVVEALASGASGDLVTTASATVAGDANPSNNSATDSIRFIPRSVAVANDIVAKGWKAKAYQVDVSDAAAVAMLGASNRIPDDALPLFAGKRVRSMAHVDPLPFVPPTVMTGPVNWALVALQSDCLTEATRSSPIAMAFGCCRST